MTFKFSSRIINTLALAVIGASLTYADDFSYNSSYASVSILNNSLGSFAITYNSGLYQFYGGYASGNGSYGGQPFTDGVSYLGQYSQAAAGAPQGSGFVEDSYSFVLGVTNFSNYAETYTAVVSTESYVFGSINGFEGQGSGYSIGDVYDSSYYSSGYTTGFDQFSEAGTSVSNFAGASSVWFALSYTNGGFSEASGYYGGSYQTLALAGLAELTNVVYSVTVAPGATDLVYIQVQGSSEAVHTSVPAPGALLPFAVGLVGTLRRRRKR